MSISAKVIKHCFGELVALKYTFDLSLFQGVFPDKLKIAKVILSKNDEKFDFL